MSTSALSTEQKLLELKDLLNNAIESGAYVLPVCARVCLTRAISRVFARDDSLSSRAVGDTDSASKHASALATLKRQLRESMVRVCVSMCVFYIGLSFRSISRSFSR